MLLLKDKRKDGSAHRFGLATVAILLGIVTATPALSIDARLPGAAMVPIKAEARAPDGAAHLCTTYDWACAKTGRVVAVTEEALSVVNAVNRRANRSIRPISDMAQYRIEERWALPTKRGGDCEDYAIFKKLELIKAGFAPEQLLIATVLDRNRQSHAVLVLRTGSQDLVLDNLQDRIVPWHKTGYTFLRMQDPRQPTRWASVLAGGLFSGS